MSLALKENLDMDLNELRQISSQALPRHSSQRRYELFIDSTES